MKPNPFAGLAHSRKFWLVVVSAITAILGLWVAAYCTPTMAALIMATWAACGDCLTSHCSLWDSTFCIDSQKSREILSYILH